MAEKKVPSAKVDLDVKLEVQRGAGSVDEVRSKQPRGHDPSVLG